MAERDGSEPQVLLLLTLVLIALTIALSYLIAGASPAARLLAMALGLIGSAPLLMSVPFLPPLPQIAGAWPQVFLVVEEVLLIAAAAQWAARRDATMGLLLLLLIPVCFMIPAPASLSLDLSCILAPALRLRDGFPLREVYFQYDLFPSLIAMAWQRLGGDPAMFFICTRASFFLFLGGCFMVTRRLFADRRLAGLLLVALCVVRIYGNIIDNLNAFPQVTPLRVNMWIVLLAVALHFGLEHWAVGLATGLVFFFLRGFGMLYVGSYALALIAEFCARRAASDKPPGLAGDISGSLRRVAPSLAFMAIGIAAARLTFGGFVPDAVLLYHRLGPGMMRIAPGSFYWWIAPGIATTGALAFQCRRFLPEKRAQAALFAVALAVGNSVYFFGRSHENNLLNISSSLLLTLFLGVDLAGSALERGRALRLVRAIPWLALAMAAFFYSGKIFDRAGRQSAFFAKSTPPLESPQPVVCGEINAFAPDRRVFIFSAYDYWFYERCGYVPQGYIQPFYLQLLSADVIAQMNGLLAKGYKVVVPKGSDGGVDFSEFAPRLINVRRRETANYFFYEQQP